MTARQVGIGAVKYADLSIGHDTEYVFDFDRMLALSGNTGPYVQYAAARIRSILRKAGVLEQHTAGDAGELPERGAAGTDAAGTDSDGGTPATAIAVVEPAERALALHLLEYGATLHKVREALEPHRLCAYLFELAQLFTSFYDQCPVLSPRTRSGNRGWPCAPWCCAGCPGPGPAGHRDAGEHVSPADAAARGGAERAGCRADRRRRPAARRGALRGGGAGLALRARWPTPWPRPTPPDGSSCWSGSTSGDAGFTALGLALATGAPAAVLTTSGTAVGNLLPAVMEANHAAVPLVVVSADRPEELRGTGANQTTVQLDLFGEHVRFAADVPAGSDPRRAVETALSAATGAFEDTPPGPVQLNLAFRDPLVPAPRRQAAARVRPPACTAPPRGPLALDFPPRLCRPAGAAHRGAGRARRRPGRRGVRPRPRPAAAGRTVLQRAVRAERGGAVPDCARRVRSGVRAADRARGALRPAHPLPAGERPAGPRRCPLRPVPAGARGLVRAGPPHRTPARQPGRPRRLRRPGLRGVAGCLAAGRGRRAARR